MSRVEFEIHEELSRSAELRLCRARRPHDRQTVLLKLPHGDDGLAVKLLEHELALTRDLEVEGVPSAVELGEHADAHALVLDDVPGISLDRLLSRGPLPLPEALDIGRQLATTLSALHRRDLIHRDLRPVHVLYDEADGKAYLTGLGRAAQVSRDVWRIPAPEALEGDPTYLAPEATGRLARQLDYRADLYSLGVMLFEMLTGRPPFTDSDPMARVHAHIAREPPDPKSLQPEVPVAVSAILAKLLAKTAAERYRSGLGLAHDLERCLTELEASGEICPFEPGEGDVAERFELPKAVVGRDTELAWLEEALETDGRPAVRLVAGYSGVGKTALVDALRASVRRRQGFFAGGRHEPEQTVPYGALLGALGALVHQKLGRHAEQLEDWTQRLRAELDVQLGLLTEVLPELASLFDEVPPVPATEPANVRSRFHGCIVRFLTTLTDGAEDAPLVLFLDDLQWIDPATAELLPHLTGVDGFLLLGAYRDTEVGEDHPLTLAVAELRARNADVDTLSLAPLAENAIGQLIIEALLTPAESLTELVYRKTAGNPFFARTFLLTLHQRGLLYLSEPSPDAPPRWTWDLEQIAALEATENVVDLVALRLTELAPAAQRTLALAAVLGKEIARDVLEALSDGEPADPADDGKQMSTEDVLLTACHAGFLVELDSPRGDETERYDFVHDRVREGAVALLTDAERAEAHLRISRLLRQRAADGEAVDIFEITEHSSHARHLISDPDERWELVRLHQEAGRQARSSGAFPAAHRAFAHALDLLEGSGDDPWQQSYEPTHALYIHAAETACLAGDFDTAERLEDVVLSQARSLLDKVPAEETRAYRLFSQRRQEESLRLQLEVVGRLGVEIPLAPTASDLWPAVLAADRAVAAVQSTVENQGVDDLPAMRNLENIAAGRLLMRIAMHASWYRHNLSRIAMCRLVELTAEAGVHPVSPTAYAMMADVRQGELGDLDGAREVGELGMALMGHPAATSDSASCRFVFDIVIGGLAEHPAGLRERFLEAYHRSVAAGDPLIASGAAYQAEAIGLFAGIELTRLEVSVRESQEWVQRIGQQTVGHVIDGIGRLIGVLLGRCKITDAVDHMGDVPREAEGPVRVRLICLELLVRALLRDPEAPAVARECLAMPKGMLPGFSLEFLCCLSLLDAAARTAEPEPAEIAPSLERLEARARKAPEVQAHKHDLIRAHRHRVSGRISEALEACERAIEGARRNRFPHEEALAHELAIELCLDPSVGREDAAATHLDEALSLYRQWGASAKVEQLEESFPDLFSDTPASSFHLDVSSFEQAGQVLASELDLARLLQRLAAVLLQNAGAQRAFLIRASSDHLAVEVRAESATPEPRVELLEELPVEACEELPATVVRFVARALEVVIFDGASQDSRFAGDPYLERLQPRSILCLPLLHRGEALEIVYLENRTSPGVFSTERSGAVRLLASQAAAALANARLHDSLKKEVETRRRAEADLRQALEEVDALKNRLEAENVYLQEEIQSHFEEIVGDSEAIRKVLYKVEQVAATDATVLILGETGTGKELITRALHRLSRRRDRPLVKVNCAALPETLIESELFGHEKGAFTGALSRKTGRFELADSGTLFLDEIGDLPMDLQAKLLRVLQEGELERLGGTKTTKVDVRVVAATNRDLEKAMADGSFRPDLYYRLTVFPIEVPPLRERDGDIPLLVRFFIDSKRGPLGSRVEKIPQAVMERLVRYSWPGNVRELENVVERALILSPEKTLRLEKGFGGAAVAAEEPQRLSDVERAHILSVLEVCGWKIKGQNNAAERLGLPPPTLRDRMKKLGIVRPQ